MSNLKRKRGRPPGRIDANAKQAPIPAQNVKFLIVGQFVAGLSIEAVAGLHNLRQSQIESIIRECFHRTGE